jgi:glycosyltransferase involved in cell wall biosynthesis
MRILAVDLGPHRRGGQRQTALVCADLARRGQEVRLAALPGSPLLHDVADLAREIPTLSVVAIPSGSEASPRVLLSLRHAVREFRPDVVYAGDARGHGALFFSGASRHVPLVVHRRVVFAPGRNPFSRMKYGAVDRFWAVSDAVVSALVHAGVPQDRIRIVPDGLSPEAFRASPPPAERPFRLVHVGAFDGQKGQDLVVDVVARLVSRGLDVTALFLGDGPEISQVKDAAARAGVLSRCTFAGSVEDVADRLAGSHLLLLPSNSEGAPLALVEAMAAGCPVLAHDVGGAAEMVAGGEAGRLLPDLDPARWEAAVLQLLESPGERARLIEAGRRAAEPRRIARTVALIESELRDVLAHAGGAG